MHNTGAAIASLFEVTRKNPPRPNDEATVRIAKKLSLLLLALSFTFEIAVVFITTVLGTFILGKGEGFKGHSNDKASICKRAHTKDYAFMRMQLGSWIYVCARRMKSLHDKIFKCAMHTRIALQRARTHTACACVHTCTDRQRTQRTRACERVHKHMRKHIGAHMHIRARANAVQLICTCKGRCTSKRRCTSRHALWCR